MESLIITPGLPKNAKEAIKEFVSSYDLETAKLFVWEITKAALCSDNFETGKEREHIAGFGENLMALIESFYVKR